MDWCVYLIKTTSDTFYCGATNDIQRRFAMHVAGKGAKYLRANPPGDIVWVSEFMTRSDALKLESAIKKKSRQAKELMASEYKREER